MFENKEIKVILSEEADQVFQELNSMVGEEKIKGIESSFHQTLLRSIQRTISLLKGNPFAGNQIPKRQLPDRYLRKYDAENAWRIELANRWRLIYTITGNKLEIINFIMDIFNHKNYDRIFGYKH
ncbi:hypothetical protein COU59_02840 [Candidatus Pacearchaeota archaeon CG10_big_fil_rev_8_21_14_0_10_34_12]|nr:MAG: hypothetical protein COU59_02840 [Candidatus Pacearchaeota archaeon CG10_big_fil_rev_8_21_14_0_10_34_12]